VRVDPEEFRRLALEVHAFLADVPVRDVTAVDLPGGGRGRTISEVRALVGERSRLGMNPVVRLLFGVRLLLGRIFGWDRETHARPDLSYLSRVSPALAARSRERPGTRDGAFRVLYVLEREALAEIRNATVHAFLAYALEEKPAGYRLYWAVYVKPVSWATPLYMAMIEPFRRFLVYPAIMRDVRRAWDQSKGKNSGPASSTSASPSPPDPS
jgi:hypothetical protein